jgi:hypothetical protein
MEHLKKAGGGGISVDGTKIHANADKHAAVSCKRATEMIAEIEREAAELVAKAESADSTPLEEGLAVPKEIKRREDRKGALERAEKAMEARYEEAEAGQEKQSGSTTETAETGGKSGGQEKTGPNNTKARKASQPKKPLEEYQYNCRPMV